MALSAGARLGSYEILSPLGVGGMGEVYRARDATLHRDVALKVLPEAFASDPDRLARFRREAQVLAALNHPNIAAIYGFEESTSVHAIVLELVEGPTLADRIADAAPRKGTPYTTPDVGRAFTARHEGRGLPLDEALAVARQIAEALEAAHEQGIIHRDLKPANIKLRPDGVVKVLDFGLAKALEHAPPEGGAYVRGDGARGDGVRGDGVRRGDLPPSQMLRRTAEALAEAGQVALPPSQAPTITSPALLRLGYGEAGLTGIGTILGTAAYMAPEQAKGREADKRSDLWAFGVVLYEMLTGTRPFDGEDMTEVLGAVVRLEPNWAALPSDVPLPVRTLLQQCLVKDRHKRIADIAAALFVLDHQTGASVTTTASAAPLPLSPLWRRVVVPLAAALVTSVLVGLGAWFATRPPPPRVSRLTLAPSGTAALTINGTDRDMTITPDGSRIVYVGVNGALFVRALDALAPVSVFTGAPRGPFVSPDSQWIGFVDNNNVLKKVAVTGGPAVTIAVLDGGGPRGATWALDDSIVVATNNPSTGLQRVAADGSTTILTRPDRAQGEADHLWPETLLGGRAVLFTITALTGGLNAAQVAVLDLQTGTRRTVLRGGSHAHYVSTGHLVYAAGGALRAVPFDPATLETRGAPVPVVPDVVTTETGALDTMVAGDGTLAYVSGGGAGAQRMIVWVDRAGHETPIPAPPRAYVYPRMSPDGTRVALWANDQERDIWVWELGRTRLTRVTFDPAYDGHPVWTPDGRRLIFSSERAGARNLYWQASDGSGAVERLTDSPNQQSALTVSPDGRRLIFTETDPTTGDDLMQLELDTSRRVTPLVQSSFAERNGVVSPDGRWLAYEATNSGRTEIYVRPFPDVSLGYWQVSTGGGTRPLWARSGEELVYVSPAGALMRVGVERAPSWAATTPTERVKDGYITTPGGNPGRTYDIAPDGQRFLMIKEGGGADQTTSPRSLIVVQNWTEELKRLVPAN